MHERAIVIWTIEIVGQLFSKVVPLVWKDINNELYSRRINFKRKAFAHAAGSIELDSHPYLA